MFQGKVFRMEDFSVLLFPVFVNVTSFINNKIVVFFTRVGMQMQVIWESLTRGKGKDMCIDDDVSINLHTHSIWFYL